MLAQERGRTIVNVTATFRAPNTRIISITNADIAALAPCVPLSDDIVDKLMHLGNARETHLLRSARLANPPRAYKRSLWLSTSFLHKVQLGLLADAVDLCGGLFLSDCHYVFVPFRDLRDAHDMRDNHAGFVLDVQGRKGYLVVPSYSSANIAESDALLLRKPVLVDLINQAFAFQAAAVAGGGAHAVVVFPDNAVTLFHGEGPQNSYASIQDGFDSGVMLLTLFDFIFHMCPAHIRRRQWVVARQRLAVALYQGRFLKDV